MAKQSLIEFVLLRVPDDVTALDNVEDPEPLGPWQEVAVLIEAALRGCKIKKGKLQNPFEPTQFTDVYCGLYKASGDDLEIAAELQVSDAGLVNLILLRVACGMLNAKKLDVRDPRTFRLDGAQPASLAKPRVAAVARAVKVAVFAENTGARLAIEAW